MLAPSFLWVFVVFIDFSLDALVSFYFYCFPCVESKQDAGWGERFEDQGECWGGENTTKIE